MSQPRLQSRSLFPDEMMTYEEKAHAFGYRFVAGVDEAGRGPLAGPVVAAACILPKDIRIEGIRDSKQMTPAARSRVFRELLSHPDLYFGIGVVDALIIDQINILQATFQAMLIAIAQLPPQTDYVLIDGNQMPAVKIPGEAIVKGDSLSLSIASASIIAKVIRDQMMDFFDLKWPEYLLKQNKGYGTGAHLRALEQKGPSPIHRMSFEPLKSSPRTVI